MEDRIYMRDLNARFRKSMEAGRVWPDGFLAGSPNFVVNGDILATAHASVCRNTGVKYYLHSKPTTL